MALPNKTKIPVGTVLAGKYKITREIGRGGMAAVYEAANVDIGKRVAIKVLAQELTTSAVVVERFLREARAAAAIRSPFICDIYDSGRLDDGRPFLVLELLEGESLYERMTKIRWLDIETTVSIVTQVCRGLTKAHAANIVHRDLKPENIFLTKDEESKLLSKILDFGLAKFYTSMDAEGPQARLTREGAVFGTPAYMSPEQVRGQGAVDHRADLWALGCIVYECFTGRTVWSTEQGVAMTFAQIANAQLPRPSTYRPDLPEAFTTWFDRALDRDISKRFQSAKEFAEKFAAVFDKEKPEISTIVSTPALLRDLSKDALENPFLSNPGPGPSNPGAPETPPPQQVSVVPSGGTRQVAPDAATEPPPPRTSVPNPASGPSSGGSRSAEITAGPPSPRPSKLGFAAPDAEGAKRARRASPLGRAAMLIGGLGLAGGLGYLVWTQISDAPAVRTGTTTSASASSAPAPSPSATPSASASLRPTSTAPVPPWVPAVREGQEALAKGDINKAEKIFKDAWDHMGGHNVPKMLYEHVHVPIAAGDKGPCHLTGLAHPRSYDLPPSGPKPFSPGRPTIAIGAHGAVIAWTNPPSTDVHDLREHAYFVALDDAMRDTDAPLDVTPEAQGVQNPELYPVGDKLLLLYADAKGAEAGVHARFLEADGRFAGPVVAVSPAMAVSAAKPYTANWPSLSPAPDGTFYAAWAEDRDNDSDDIFLRHLGANLDPEGEPIRATDLVQLGASKPRARYPWLALAGGAAHLVFRLDREPTHLVEHLRFPLADAAKGGLPPPKKGERNNRNLGDMVVVNTDKSRADVPSFACGGGSCYVAYHVEPAGGVWVARIDPAAAPKAPPRWQVSRFGGQAAVAVSAKGDAQVAWFEGKQLLTASITGDRVGPSTRIAHAVSELPFSLVRGTKPGEWYVAWVDWVYTHNELFAARVQCK